MSVEPTRPASESSAPFAGPLSAAVKAAAEAAPAPPDAPVVEGGPPAEGGSGGPDGGRGPRGDRRGPRPPKGKKEGGPREAPVFVPKKSMELGRRGRLSAEMEQEINDALGGLSLDEAVNVDQKISGQLERDSRHRAQVVEVHGDNVFFALGGKAQGVASVRAFPEGEIPEPGSMVDVTVMGYNAEDDLYNVMAAGGTMTAADFGDLQEGSVVEAKITAANTGGLECQVNAVRGFIPAGQVGIYRTENLGDFVGKKLICVVTQADERRGNVILSRRAILEREKEESKKKLFAELQPGDMHEGVVRKIQDFGAFVDLGSGVDGLIHVSQLSWERVKHPSEILKEGQKVRVRIEKIDQESGRIGLTLKNPEEHPWNNIDQRFPVGTTVKGPISRIAQFGAFVKLAPGVEGLIHISELAHFKVYKVENVVKEGQEVECKVQSIDTDQQRMSLSLKAALPKPEKADKDKKADEPEVDEPPRELAVKRPPGPLKGGTNKPSGGESFGLKW